MENALSRVLPLMGVLLSNSALWAAATLSIGQTEMKTYPFSDPDPIPAVNSVRYPYCRYDGSTDTATTRAWQTVTLENESIRVTLFPEIGGKVWGATDKKTGRDFIYYNHVVKFRDIAMRGPWCSGGIEFNFGVIGHAPSCSTPVDWLAHTNADGSVSCFIASSEYITRSRWQVEVRLAPQADYFETHTTWYNASGLEQPYYHWMNAAYSTRHDPEFLFPGAYYIGHGGDAHAWPRDEAGHALNHFSGNTFGGPKSYHVLPGNNGVYGIWWPQLGVGAVHRSAAYEKYGRKIWLWALSREGGIWEDLLTDTDGQYTELQSGRAFNQPRPQNGTPFKLPSFAPGATETFDEQWGVIRSRDALDKEKGCADALVERPREGPVDFDWSTPWGLAKKAHQELLDRNDRKAEETYRAALAKDRYLMPALTGLAAIELRRGAFAAVHTLCNRALALDAYASDANYLDGRAYFLEGQNVTARDRLGVAAFQPQYRAAAYALIARTFVREGKLQQARDVADKALQFNALSFDAHLVKLIAARGTPFAVEYARDLLTRFPLFHAARYELGRVDKAVDYRALIRNELAAETYQDLGEWYADTGLTADALAFYAAVPNHPLAGVCAAYVQAQAGDKAAATRTLQTALKQSVAGVFPFRLSTQTALNWAQQKMPHWKWAYYRGVLSAFFNRPVEAAEALAMCDAADEAEVFMVRAQQRYGQARLKDLKRAKELKDGWRVGRALAAYYTDLQDWPHALAVTTDYIARYPKCNPLQIAHANALVKNGYPTRCMAFLRGVKILPSESRDSATEVWQEAEKLLDPKCTPTWPENLGRGKPYPDVQPKELY